MISQAFGEIVCMDGIHVVWYKLLYFISVLIWNKHCFRNDIRSINEYIHNFWGIWIWRIWMLLHFTWSNIGSAQMSKRRALSHINFWTISSLMVKSINSTYVLINTYTKNRMIRDKLPSLLIVANAIPQMINSFEFYWQIWI